MKVSSIEVDRNNAIWFCTNSGIHKIISIQRQPESYLSGKHIIDVAIDPKGKAYAAGLTELYDVETEARNDLPSASAIISDIDYYDGQIWVGTSEGLFLFRPTNQKFTQVNTRNSKLKSDDINFVEADELGKLWIGTADGSIEIEGDKWRFDFKKEKMVATRENDEGQWFITDQDMYILSKFGRIIRVGLNEQLYRGKLNDFVLDSKGRIYFASDILVRYNPYTEEIESYEDDAGLISRKCISLACDKNDNIWIGTQDGGLFRILFADIVAEQLTAAVLIESEISCYGASDASLKVTVAGGQRPYNYSWSIPTVRGDRPSGLKAGAYTVTVSDKYNASFVASVDVVEPAALEIIVLSKTKVSGPAKFDGTAEVTTSGGIAPVTVKWSDGQKGYKGRNMRAGRYEVTATDAKGCSVTEYVDIPRDKFIPELDITKVNVGQVLKINELHFDADSSSIKPESYEVLDEVYDFLVANQKIKIEIGGHTNTIPPHEYCDKLSSARARMVSEYLWDRGIRKERIEHTGYGKRQPIDTGVSRAAQNRNQRVEIKILSLEG